jgi:hypothetical protein
MTGSGMEDDIRRQAARHVRGAHKGVRDIYAESIRLAATREPARTLKVARDELDDIAGILEDIDSAEHWDMVPGLRDVGESLSGLKLETLSQVLIDIRDAISTLQKDAPT